MFSRVLHFGTTYVSDSYKSLEGNLDLNVKKEGNNDKYKQRSQFCTNFRSRKAKLRRIPISLKFSNFLEIPSSKERRLVFFFVMKHLASN